MAAICKEDWMAQIRSAEMEDGGPCCTPRLPHDRMLHIMSDGRAMFWRSGGVAPKPDINYKISCANSEPIYPPLGVFAALTKLLLKQAENPIWIQKLVR